MNKSLLKFFSIAVLFFIVPGQVSSAFSERGVRMFTKSSSEPISQKEIDEVAQGVRKEFVKALAVRRCCSESGGPLEMLKCCSKLEFECCSTFRDAAEVFEFCSKLKDGEKAQKGASEQGGEEQEIVKQDDD